MFRELEIGDMSPDGQITIVDKDRLCYLVKSKSRGAEGFRTISKSLLNEFVAYLSVHPDEKPLDVRDALTGLTTTDKFEYGYYSSLCAMAQMVLSKPAMPKQIPHQVIYYGTPGTGKSYKVSQVTANGHVFRTTFHPESDYATFVGGYKPTMRPTGEMRKINGEDVEIEEIAYEFVPQAFTNAYTYAYNHPIEDTFLVIEEINRGNCAQIFGDLFQLLDRKNGISEYPIKADADLAKYLRKHLNEEGQEGISDDKLCLPANLHILATMNTSDQSLFPMDSAFKRRWNWKYVPIDYSDKVESYNFMIEIGAEKYRWVTFLKAVNKEIDHLTSSEDKMMGNFFIKSNIDSEEFKDKVMFYLWNEVCKDEYKVGSFFKDEKGNEFSFSQLYEVGGDDLLHGFMRRLKNEYPEIFKKENEEDSTNKKEGESQSAEQAAESATNDTTEA